MAAPVDSELVTLYWSVGKRVRKHVLGGERAQYGGEIVKHVAAQLTLRYGRGFTKSSLSRMMAFAEAYPVFEIVAPLAQQLTWTNVVAILTLGLPPEHSESDLENAILEEMQRFLVELGAGFAFIARQKRMVIDGRDYHLDLLFYHRGLGSLVAIELKARDFEPGDFGQMTLYLRWLDKHDRVAGENSPVGLILCARKGPEQTALLGLDEGEIRAAQYLTEPLREEMRLRLEHAVGALPPEEV